MQKIISLFQRNYETDRLVRDEIVPGAEWVVYGDGLATRKWDGTCCLIKDGFFFKRYEVKKGGQAPDNFEPVSDIDPNTGKQQGWVPVGDGPEDRYHREAYFGAIAGGLYYREAYWSRPCPFIDGTYELCGPKINGNPERFSYHRLIRHGVDLVGAPRTFEGLREWLAANDVEGIVWHHWDGRMVKIKGKDFGLKRARKEQQV